VMFVIEWDLISIGTIEVPTHIEPIFKPICISDFSITESVPKQLIELVCVLATNLVILPHIIKTTLTWNFLPSISGRNDRWWNTFLKTNAKFNHSGLDNY
jgi:hypothetical protein